MNKKKNIGELFFSEKIGQIFEILAYLLSIAIGMLQIIQWYIGNERNKYLLSIYIALIVVPIFFFSCKRRKKITKTF